MKETLLPLGLGTAAIGRPQYINIRQEAHAPLPFSDFEQQGREVLDEAYRLGIRYFDTAPGYGMAEKLLLRWLEQQQDPEIVVATKWGYTYVADFDPRATQHEVKEHSLKKLKEQWAYSRQLKPWLKVYQIHSATFASGVLDNKEVLEHLAHLKKEHDLLIGLTTSGADQAELIKHAVEIHADGQPLFDLVQVTYNLLDQSVKDVLSLLEGRRIVIKEALANGRLLPQEKYPHYRECYAYMTDLSGKYGTGVDAIALRFVLDSIRPYQVLSGAGLPVHVASNAKALGFQLTTEELDRLHSFKIEPSAYWSERKQLGWN